mmetsp:Transcript_39033/g.64240  ORF Transcript_39033/g.64240 Transcript_39033/m.64240 type:complete len:330 (+) Transcript_39033:343-1332(+)
MEPMALHSEKAHISHLISLILQKGTPKQMSKGCDLYLLRGFCLESLPLQSNLMFVLLQDATARPVFQTTCISLSILSRHIHNILCFSRKQQGISSRFHSTSSSFLCFLWATLVKNTCLLEEAEMQLVGSLLMRVCCTVMKKRKQGQKKKKKKDPEDEQKKSGKVARKQCGGEERGECQDSSTRARQTLGPQKLGGVGKGTAAAAVGTAAAATAAARAGILTTICPTTIHLSTMGTTATAAITSTLAIQNGPSTPQFMMINSQTTIATIAIPLVSSSSHCLRVIFYLPHITTTTTTTIVEEGGVLAVVAGVVGAAASAMVVVVTELTSLR